MLQRKASLAAVDNRKDSALIVAAFGGFKDVCEVLLQAGADKTYKGMQCRVVLSSFDNVFMPGNCGRSAAEWAAQQGHADVASLINSWQPVRSSVRLFFHRGVAQYKRGDLAAAAKEGDVKKMEWCLARGAHIEELDNEPEYNRTALIWAARKGHKAAVEFLLSRNASLLAVDRRKDSALIVAAFGGYKDVCQVLLQAGADKSYKGNCGRSAAEWAANQGHAALVEFINSFSPVLPLWRLLCALHCLTAGLIAVQAWRFG